jgi:hypothetical protein
MDPKLRWLKVSFLAGAVADGVLVILLLIPSRMGETEFTYPMGLAASLMLGWTVLLIWGYQKPFERRGILLATIFPVIPGLIASGIYSVAIGAFPVAKVLPSTIVGIALIALMGYSYMKASRFTTL